MANKKKEIKGGLKNADNVTRVCINIVEADNGSGVSINVEGSPKGPGAMVWLVLLTKDMPALISRIGHLMSEDPEEAERQAIEVLAAGKDMQEILEES